MKLVKSFKPHVIVFRQKMFLINRFVERKSRNRDCSV